MPALQTTVGYLNIAFGERNIAEFATNRDAFASGKRLSSGVKLTLPQPSPLLRHFVSYVDGLPASFQEIIRSTIYYALSTNPPTQVTFAWAPGYDFELTAWQAPDTRATRGGITVLLKSRYPDDTHPLSGRAGTRRRSRA